jgi:uncharacterized coiled-coil protein SlyX
MAQIIRHRRGSLEALSAATSSFQKGELIIVSGSSNITATNGSGMVFAAVESGSIQAVNRFMIGDSAPNSFASSTYNGLVKGVPYYASGSSTLYLLGSDGNDIPDLTGNISNFSASVATSFSASQASQTALSASVSSVTGEFSSSVATSFSASNASIVALSASVASVTGDFSSSVAQTFTTQSQRISSLESFSGSYATTGSNVFKGEQIISSSLIVTNEIKGTGSIFLQPDVDDSRKLEIYNTAPTDIHIKGNSGLTFLGDDTNFVKIDDNLQTITIEGVNGVFVTGIEETIGEFSQSVDSRFSASVASITSLSASVASVTGDFSSSVATSFSASAYNVSASNASQDIRIDQLASFSGSYATTGSNVFFGVQTITGSLYITQDLIVQGSSSLQNVTASAVSIGTNQINLNTDFPAFRYAGLNVYDSGSSGVSASLQWDSLNDQWIFVHQESGSATVDSSILMYGPLSTAGLGSEATLTGNFLTKIENNGHGHHLTTSSIEDTGTNVSIHNSLDVTGSINVKDSASTFGLSGNGFGETYLTSYNGTIILEAQNGGVVNVKATDLTVDGTISGSSIVGLGNATEYSQSVSASLASITANVGAGVGVSITNLNAFSSSTLGRLDNIELFSSSVETKLTEIGVVSGSLISSASTAKTTNDTQDGRLDNLETTSASVNTSVTALNTSSASLNTFSGSTLDRLSNLESTSASVNTSITNINSFSSSVLTQLTEIGVVSGSLIASASTAKTTNDAQGVRLGELESKSSSVDISIAALNSYTSSNTSTTALNAFTASAIDKFTEIGVVSGSLISSASAAKSTNDTQDDRLTNIESFSASVNTSVTNINSFTSSVDTKMTEIGVVSGSLISSASAASISIAALNAYTSSNTSTTALNNFTASAETRFTEIGVVSGSLIVSASTAKTTNDTQDGRLTNLEATSASVNTSVSALNSSSASQQISIDALNTVSGSNLDRLTQLETASGSAKVSISELNNYTSSLKTAFTLSGQNVEVLGDFTVRGSTTTIDATTIQLGDNIIELNGSGVANGGLLVKDNTSPNTASGSLLWDSTNDYWKAGALGAESKLLRQDGDSVVSGSSQITISSTTGFDTFSGSISTDFSASNASITSLSASVASVTGDFSSSVATSFSASAASQLSLSSSFATSQGVQDTRLGLLETSTGSLNLFTSSIDTTIKTKLDAETVVSGSSQIDITATTGFTTFSASIETRISLIDGGTY